MYAYACKLHKIRISSSCAMPVSERVKFENSTVIFRIGCFFWLDFADWPTYLGTYLCVCPFLSSLLSSLAVVTEHSSLLSLVFSLSVALFQTNDTTADPRPLPSIGERASVLVPRPDVSPWLRYTRAYSSYL